MRIVSFSSLMTGERRTRGSFLIGATSSRLRRLSRVDLIRPLQQNHAVASAEVNTGYVNRQTKRVVSPWVQKFDDLYGLHQDYASTRKGLKDAADAGVLDIESHGWTHMEPDLESAPGPWWTADLAGE